MVLRKIVCLVLLATLTNFMLSCWSQVYVPKDELNVVTEIIAGLVLRSGEQVDFNEYGGRYNRDQELFEGATKDGREVSYSLYDVAKVKLERVAGGKSERSAWTASQYVAFKSGQYSEKIVGAVLLSGDLVKFGEPNPRLDPETNSLVATTTDGMNVRISLDDILYFQVQKIDTAKSILAAFGVTALVFASIAAIALATKESCPFIYSYDGERFSLDAEPLGGAISSGLERRDFSRMELLAPVDGEYRIFINNEVEETQYLNELKLIIVDHEPGLVVMPDSQENLFFAQDPVPPATARDEEGGDLMKFVRQQDGISWQTKMPIDSSQNFQSLYHDLTFAFPKPSDADEATLLINAGTTLWGSNMIREMLILYGDELDDWYAAIDSGGPAVEQMFSFLQREQIYLMEINVWEDTGWVCHGYIQPGGPLITEDRVIPIDISGVVGDSLILNLTPPVGYWTIDCLAVEFGPLANADFIEVPVKAARDRNQNDVLPLLTRWDDEYLVLPEVGDWAEVTFAAPSQEAGMERSIFLSSAGYYKIHLPDNLQRQTATQARIGLVKGGIIEYSLSRWHEWLAEMSQTEEDED